MISAFAAAGFTHLLICLFPKILSRLAPFAAQPPAWNARPAAVWTDSQEFNQTFVRHRGALLVTFGTTIACPGDRRHPFGCARELTTAWRPSVERASMQIEFDSLVPCFAGVAMIATVECFQGSEQVEREDS